MRKGRLTPFSLFIFSVVCFVFSLAGYGRTIPLPARLSANGYASDFAVGQADLMLPLRGDRGHNFYVDPTVSYASDSQGYADLGVGYRWIQNEAAILGGYLFGGYSRIDNNARLWVVNPGIEALGSRWDAHLNGYLAMGDRNKTLVGSGGGGFIHFTGHSQVQDYLSGLVQHAGHGADAQFAYQLFPQTSLKGYVGSYFFSPSQTSDIWGGAAGLEYWVDSHIKVFASYTYDTVHHHTGAVGVGVEWGGTHVHRSDPLVAERITDPVQRYLAALGRGSAIPSRNATVASGGQQTVLLNNIAFFSETGTPDNGGVRALTQANCTFENPCGPTDFSQIGVDTLNSLLPNTIMYFNGGEYPILDASGGAITTITLHNGQSVHSRTADYSQPAEGAARSIFDGAFMLSGNNILDRIILLPGPGASPGTGVLVSGDNVQINGSQIGSNLLPFSAGVQFSGVVDGVIMNSQIFGQGGGVLTDSSVSILSSLISIVGNPGSFATALQARSGSVTQVIDSVINAEGSHTNGISGEDVSHITVQHSSIDMVGGDIGIVMHGGAVANLQDTIVNVDTLGGAGILLADTSSLNLGENSVIIVTGDSSNPFSKIGIVTSVSAKAVADGVSIQVTSNTPAGFAEALRADVAGSIQVNNGTLRVSGSSSPTIKSGPGAIHITNSTCFLNGTQVSCP